MVAALALLVGAPPDDADDDMPPTAVVQDRTKPQALPRRAFNLWALLPDAARDAELSRRHRGDGPFGEVLERVTRGFVGAPYLLSPLGEGTAPDPDPKFRVDAFDCTTFVETAIAVAYTDRFADAARLLDGIRYDGAPAFEHRRHFIVAQWVPGLRDKGVLQDVTRLVGGEATVDRTFDFSAARWKRRRIAKTLKLDEDRLPFGEHAIPIVPIAAMAGRAHRIPPGTIVNVVRIDVPWSPVLVTHQGLVLTPRGENIRIVRHASPVSKRVIDETLEHMLKRYSKPRKWPIAGLNFQRIVDPQENLH